jgi:hypothetical protein
VPKKDRLEILAGSILFVAGALVLTTWRGHGVEALALLGFSVLVSALITALTYRKDGRGKGGTTNGFTPHDSTPMSGQSMAGR